MSDQKKDALKAISAVSNVLATNTHMWPDDERKLQAALTVLQGLAR